MKLSLQALSFLLLACFTFCCCFRFSFCHRCQGSPDDTRNGGKRRERRERGERIAKGEGRGERREERGERREEGGERREEKEGERIEENKEREEKERQNLSSSSLYATRMPFPPPPAEALIIS